MEHIVLGVFRLEQAFCVVFVPASMEMRVKFHDICDGIRPEFMKL